MAQINPSIPTVGAPDSSEEPKISTALSQIIALVNGNLDKDNLATSAKPATILGQFAATPLTGSAMVGPTLPVDVWWIGTGSVKEDTVANAVSIPLVNFGSGGYTVPGLTAMGRVTASVLVNGTPPACNLTFGLYGIASNGGAAGALSIATSGALAGSTAAINAPAANSRNQAVSADFALPTSGVYGLAFVTSASWGANSEVMVNAALQVHWV
jgi:hypothetical protein